MRRPRHAVRTVVIVVLAAIVAATGVGVGVVLYKKHAGRDVRGSSTVEFVPTEVPAPPPARRLATISWPTFGYDAARLHVAPVKGLRPPFRTAWVAGGSSLLEFPPAVAFGRLFFANGAGHVLALSTRSGRRAWDYDAKRCVAASPAIGRFGGGTVYQTFLNRKPCTAKRSDDGEVVALAAGTGQLRWRQRIGASETSPLLARGRLYVGDWLGVVHALDPATGKIDWTFHTGGPVKGAIAFDDNRVFVGSYDGHLYALDASTGRLVWRASGDPRLIGHGTFYSTPAVAYGRVYIGSTDGKVYSFGADSGRRRWSHSTGGYVYGSPAVWASRVYVGSYDGTFYAFDAATGSLDWSFRANGPISGSATVIDGVVYFATLRGRTYGLRATSGKLLWSFPDGKYTPIVADLSRVYLLGFGKVYGLVPR